MKKILVDSGPLIALFDASDKHHAASIEFIRNNPYPLVTTLATITEVLHLIDFDRNAQIDFIDWVRRGGVEIHSIENADLERIRQLTVKYHDLPMDFADSCLVLLAERLAIHSIATIDRDFTVYRINGRQKFKILLGPNRT
ncbi:MAG: PIN domain-containing protein [Candidatus Omnitrophica bacterium]|nr:PIN domain-containing protein [Candidatus Omnitrophota bacterium]